MVVLIIIFSIIKYHLKIIVMKNKIILLAVFHCSFLRIHGVVEIT